jgi:hypothetical protein
MAFAIASMSSVGRKGFGKQITLESSGYCARRSSAVTPDVAIIGKLGSRSRNNIIISMPPFRRARKCR